MYLDRIQRRVAELSDMGIEFGEPAPSNPAEINAVEQKLGIKLPGALREFYLWGAHELEPFGLVGFYGAVHQLKKDFRASGREIIEEAGEDSSILDDTAVVVQLDYDGNFAFVLGNEGDDPPLYVHVEGQPGLTKYAAFSDYLAELVEQCAGIEGPGSGESGD